MLNICCSLSYELWSYFYRAWWALGDLLKVNCFRILVLCSSKFCYCVIFSRFIKVMKPFMYCMYTAFRCYDIQILVANLTWYSKQLVCNIIFGGERIMFCECISHFSLNYSCMYLTSIICHPYQIYTYIFKYFCCSK